MVGRISVLEMYHLIERDPFHVDLSTHPDALMERENVDCLTAHLLQFGAVESLNLAGMNASGGALDQLISSAEAGGLAHLTYLNLRGTHLSPRHLESLLRVLKARAPLLRTLDISENGIGDTAMEPLKVYVPAMLQSLNIASNALSAAAVTQILQSLADAKPTSLEQLDLSDNHVDLKSSEALKTLLRTTNCQTTLKELRVAHCGLDATNSACLAEGVHSSAIEVLDVSRNDCLLSFTFAVDEGHAAAFPASLRVLDLSGNACNRRFIGGLVESLHGCSGCLEELYLRRTFQGDVALSALLCGVSSMPALRVLDLAECGLTYRSGKLLAQQLPMHPKLMVIRLSDNMLDVEGVMDMASGLERLSRLTTLELGSCHLGNCGAVAVVTSLLRSGAPIVQLDISDNDINNAGLCEVCALLSRLTCPRLERLIISRNPCTKGSQANLIEMLRGRQSACQVVAEGTPLEVTSSSSLFEAAHASQVLIE
ncbi:hypothetical protein LSCM1_04980 [Leishmania martiniquensis]|uniref:Uncharacterized protein n=1 Tax=Leishmania martiniquensis TaxID=1580590 RepID=A0A836HGY9_9TRYP|nr:hypothetical protein LSCM1_04980 [Leishmania martiniquensis]